MRPKHLIILALCAGIARSFVLAAPDGATKSAAPIKSDDSGPLLRINVDPRVELLSLIFRLAGNPEYNQARVESYAEDVETHFGTFRGHPVVALATRLRNTQGVSYDACMGMAVHLTDPGDLQFRTPLVPWPESLDRRWTVKSGSMFLAAARQFVKDTDFNGFIAKHRVLYQTTESRLKALLDQQAHLEWFRDFFGQKPNAAFTVIPGMLNGGSCFLWIQELSDLLGDYEAHRDRYPTLEAFAPRLVAFFHDYAKHFAAMQTQ